jgi:hypothetical protein
VGSSASANQTGPVPFVFGGRLCLDFANTVNCRTRPASRDYLPDYPALVEWAHQLGIIDDGSLSGLKDRGAAEPDLARKTFASAIELRETVDRLFRAVAESAQPSERDLAILNRWLRSGRAEQRLAAASPNFVWESVGIAPDLGGRQLGRRSADPGGSATGQGVPRTSGVRLALLRRHQEPQPALVQYGILRIRREGEAAGRTPSQRLT